MPASDESSNKSHGETCAVCGKDSTGSRGFARIQTGGVLVSLCCPGCMDSFDAKPDYYLSKLKYRNLSGDSGRNYEG